MAGVSPFFQELQSIITEHSHVMKSGSGDRGQYWKLRHAMSARMIALLRSAEERWLGPARLLLLGSYADPDAEAAVDRRLEESLPLLRTRPSPAERAELRVILSAVHVLRPREILAELRRVCRQESDAAVLQRVAGLWGGKGLPAAAKRRNPVILILDPVLQTFPWESIPALYEGRQPVSRVPSLQFLW